MVVIGPDREGGASSFSHAASSLQPFLSSPFHPEQAHQSVGVDWSLRLAPSLSRVLQPHFTGTCRREKEREMVGREDKEGQGKGGGKERGSIGKEGERKREGERERENTWSLL